MRIAELCTIDKAQLRAVFANHFYYCTDADCTFAGLVLAMGGRFDLDDDDFVTPCEHREDTNKRLYQGAVYLKSHEKEDYEYPMRLPLIMRFLSDSVSSIYFVHEDKEGN